MPTLLTPDQINQIVSNHHDNPHAVLGCHPTNDDPNPKPGQFALIYLLLAKLG